LISFRLHGDSRLTAISIFSLPHGNNWIFFLCLTARIDFIPPYGDSRPIMALSIFFLPHGDNQFIFASWQESISSHLTVMHASRRYQFLFASR
jgi:hypothetical protein